MGTGVGGRGCDEAFQKVCFTISVKGAEGEAREGTVRMGTTPPL